MPFRPENGLVIRYDFLWKTEQGRGRVHGVKDRPCAIVLVARPREDGSRTVVVCPVTHVPPRKPDGAVEIPPRVARHLGLDDRRSWITTHEVNSFIWQEGRIPAGVVPATETKWAFGFIPPNLYVRMRDQVIRRSRDKSLAVVKREDGG